MQQFELIYKNYNMNINIIQKILTNNIKKVKDKKIFIYNEIKKYNEKFI